MNTELPFAVQGVKIPILANEALYADLLGGTLDTTPYIPWAQVVQAMVDDGVNTVTLMVSAGVLRNYTDNAFDPALSYNPSMAAVRALVDLLQSAGLDVAINPFVHVAGVITGDGSQGAGDRARPTDPALWQQNVGASMLTWAQFAQEVGATAFIPFADETQHLLADATLTAGWLDLIADIRSVFTGHLSTGWWTDGTGDSIGAMPAAIVQAMDSLGIGFFPHLTDDADATLADLQAAYRGDRDGNDLVAMLRGLAETTGQPIWITDKAFHSFDGAAADEARIFDNDIALTQDLQEQALLYDSFLQAMSTHNGGWLMGVSFQNFNNMRDGMVSVARFMDGPLSESPQGKPAEAVMAEWFLGQRQGLGLVEVDGWRSSEVAGGYHADTLTGGGGRDTLMGLQGDDTFHAGAPSGAVMGYQVTLLMRGVQTLGIAPIVTVRDAQGAVVTSAAVTAPLNPATGVQTGQAMQLTFEVESRSGFTLEMDNWAFVDFSSTGNRFVRIEGATVNGQAVTLGAANVQYEWNDGSQAGAVDGVHGGAFTFDFASVNVAAVPMTVEDDDDRIEGGTGIDSAVYDGPLSEYQLHRDGAGFHVDGAQGQDTLVDVERLRFDDTFLAIDLDGHAGSVAKLLGAVFGAQAVANAAYAGIGLGLLDAGMPESELAALALAVRFGGAYTNEQLVGLLYDNLIGGAAPAPLVAEFAGALGAGVFTPASLVWLVAGLGFNLDNIGFAQLQAQGLAYQ